MILSNEMIQLKIKLKLKIIKRKVKQILIGIDKEKELSPIEAVATNGKNRSSSTGNAGCLLCPGDMPPATPRTTFPMYEDLGARN